ncbi:hypothetical protein EXIGLDRAFT_683644 [Exidia glandulosa HHB12029]|uniref:Cyclase n=1 Tax=Exidia glandulosa HHB12029 TaxID=1314781 RepID=A0A165D179_EXIGL|nr:hypothetical protein EXIGLDRAFT_683644 [Exidia glandulosa HHB12029]
MNDKNLPTFDELPEFKGKPGCAWEVWGKDDQLGTINLLTPDVVKRAMTEEIQTGKTVSLSWPINFPKKALFFRESADITLKAIPTLAKGDDVIHMNSQAGSQWDGMRHYGLFEDHIFYNNTPRDAIPFGKIEIADPANIDPAYVKLGIHNWAEHGICGRGVLLDLVEHYTHDGSPLPYNPWESHSFTVEDLKACAAKEGVEFRHGDILLIRGGFIKKYYEETDEARDLLAAPKRNPPAGIDPSIEMKRFIWNNHFAAAASDQPTLEHWPPKVPGFSMHETMLNLWGMPIGELFDLEALSKQCKETGRYSFFFSSWPLKIIGGCAAPPNAAAYF